MHGRAEEGEGALPLMAFSRAAGRPQAVRRPRGEPSGRHPLPYGGHRERLGDAGGLSRGRGLHWTVSVPTSGSAPQQSNVAPDLS